MSPINHKLLDRYFNKYRVKTINASSDDMVDYVRLAAHYVGDSIESRSQELSHSLVRMLEYCVTVLKHEETTPYENYVILAAFDMLYSGAPESDLMEICNDIITHFTFINDTRGEVIDNPDPDTSDVLNVLMMVEKHRSGGEWALREDTYCPPPGRTKGVLERLRELRLESNHNRVLYNFAAKNEDYVRWLDKRHSDRTMYPTERDCTQQYIEAVSKVLRGEHSIEYFESEFDELWKYFKLMQQFDAILIFEAVVPDSPKAFSGLMKDRHRLRRSLLSYDDFMRRLDNFNVKPKNTDVLIARHLIRLNTIEGDVKLFGGLPAGEELVKMTSAWVNDLQDRIVEILEEHKDHVVEDILDELIFASQVCHLMTQLWPKLMKTTNTLEYFEEYLTAVDTFVAGQGAFESLVFAHEDLVDAMTLISDTMLHYDHHIIKFVEANGKVEDTEVEQNKYFQILQGFFCKGMRLSLFVEHARNLNGGETLATSPVPVGGVNASDGV